jgi:hypothetical protein
MKEALGFPTACLSSAENAREWSKSSSCKLQTASRFFGQSDIKFGRQIKTKQNFGVSWLEKEREQIKPF